MNTIPTAQELRQLEDNTGPNPTLDEATIQSEIITIGFLLQGHATKTISGIYGELELDPKMVPYLEEKGYKVTEIPNRINWANQKTYKIEW